MVKGTEKMPAFVQRLIYIWTFIIFCAMWSYSVSFVKRIFWKPVLAKFFTGNNNVVCCISMSEKMLLSIQATAVHNWSVWFTLIFSQKQSQAVFNKKLNKLSYSCCLPTGPMSDFSNVLVSVRHLNPFLTFWCGTEGKKCTWPGCDISVLWPWSGCENHGAAIAGY